MATLIDLFFEQVNRILENKFYTRSGLSESHFINDHLMPLKQLIDDDNMNWVQDETRLPILIVVPETVVPLGYKLDRVRESIHDPPLDYIIKPEWFENAEDVSTPDQPYLLIDIDTGYALRNATPRKCIERFKNEERNALTLDEGVALITHFPEVLKSHWLDLPGSVLIHKLFGQDAMKRGMLSSLPPVFAKTTYVPTIQYLHYNSLRLYYLSDSNETPYSGSASCAKRLSPSFLP